MIFRSFWALLKLNGGIFNLITIIAEIENLMDFLFQIGPCSVLSPQPYPLLLVKNPLRNIWYFQSCIWEDKHQRFFSCHSRTYLDSTFLCHFKQTEVMRWSGLSFRRWMEWHSSDLKSAQLYHCQNKVIEEGFFGMWIKTSLLQLSCLSWLPDMLCSMSSVKRTWWETAIIYWSWHICSCPFKKWNVNWSYNHL